AGGFLLVEFLRAGEGGEGGQEGFLWRGFTLGKGPAQKPAPLLEAAVPKRGVAARQAKLSQGGGELAPEKEKARGLLLAQQEIAVLAPQGLLPAAAISGDQQGVHRSASLPHQPHALLGKENRLGDEGVVQLATQPAQREYRAAAPEVRRDHLQVALLERQ